MKIPNRFKGLGYINVNALRLSFLAGCVFNAFLFSIVLMIGAAFFFFTSAGSAGEAVKISTVPPLAVVLISTVTPAATLPLLATLPPAPTYTPAPTLTPAPSPTLIPTLAPLPTATPFTLTVVLAVPTPTPTKLYNLGEILAGAPLPALSSEKKYAFYRGVCLDGVSRIEPRVVGLPEIVQGLHWRLWNDYGFVVDTSDYEESYADDTTLFLSSDPALFHLALFYYDEAISDEVRVDYPGACMAVQIIYIKAARSGPASPDNVWVPGPLPGQMVLTNTGVLTNVSVSE